ncbi:hypothetical protein [Cytophaga hutchinsonii]|uniref:Uncharacterized protein n=1 Tax=Cytophaga hutchinsonii (strain ATCC 33406 / DSM 1761 / CIP 103989 / NBRC 15051 / NCIMB 9469 / D465) TaxID=269798 RepID=A0A6N4SPN8_CYTH3|nr:hypothetical protein [Cytophaga hutchinsonii]ABG58260.1 hypothetical protein CHU_0983 [Cytophaga hutchinsonii ATCC 33406]SFX53862.1 hypothetical protein SAMN04487930_105171 [Cytophaga hutchinsonii ATCC 33406]
MIRFKDIHIPKPCSVEYDTLPGDDIKRFCGSCEKYVYDFRGKDQAYLNAVFSATGKACGIYYADQIQASPALKTNRPFYSSFVSKLIATSLFLRIFLTSNNTKAHRTEPQTIVQQTTDSTELKTIHTGNDKAMYRVTVDIYKNDTLEESFLLENQNSIYLPDSIKPLDKIKVVVSTVRYNIPTSKNRTRSGKYMSNKTYYTTEQKKTYHFNFAGCNKIIIKIRHTKFIHIFLKKRTAIMGLVCPSDFW